MPKTENKFTPGPWKAYNADGGRIFKNWKVGGKTDRIADICELGSSEMTVANARLIAAAPELVTALKDELGALTIWGSASGLDFNDIQEGIKISRSKIFAALKLAGEEI